MHCYMNYVAQELSILGILCLTLLMELWKIHHQTPYEIEVRHDQLLGLEPDLLILNEMVSDQYISSNMSWVHTWVVHLC